jgi:hypothetical protein
MRGRTLHKEIDMSNALSNALGDLCQSLKNLWNNGQTQATLWIGIPVGLTGLSTGRLFIKDHRGRRLLDNIPLRTYGTTPIGRYTVMGIRISGSGTPYPAEVYGPEGVVIIESPQGYLTLQGGRGAQGNDLLATKGGFRVSDRDMRSIIIALETIEGPIDCHCAPLSNDYSSQSQTRRRDSEVEYQGSNYVGQDYIEQSSGDAEFLPEQDMNEVPIEEWVETVMSNDGYI